MDEKNPPAFPTQTATTYVHGMTLRDYVASQALTGLLANKLVAQRCAGRDDAEVCADLAKESYMLSDAMLAERAK